MVKVDIKELIKLREQGKTYQEISELYKSKGIQISIATISNRLNAYYKADGKKVPIQTKKGKSRINISIEEIVELKEEGKTYEEISEFYKTRGIQISKSTVGNRLKEYYEADGENVSIGAKKVKIPIEELVELNEQGETYKEISEFYKQKGIQISRATVGKRLKAYYEANGKKILRRGKRVKIPIKEIVELKEQGKTYKEILELYKQKGIQISKFTLANRLKEYYEQEGKEIPKVSGKGKVRINISIEELVGLKEQGKTCEEISELYKSKGIQISKSTIGNRLKEHYESQGERVPRSNSSDINKVTVEEIIKLKDKGETNKEISGYYKRKGIKISAQTIGKKIKEHKLEQAKEKRENIDRELKSIILNGESIRVYCERNNCPEREEEFKERIRRLKIIASKTKKVGETYIEDGEFLEVLSILENFTVLYPANKYRLNIKPYISNGICTNGKIDLIYMNVFNRNKDLMCYILSAFKFRYGQEYDNKIWEKLKRDHEAKIDRYIGRLHTIEEKRSRTNQKKSKNVKVPQDREEQR